MGFWGCIIYLALIGIISFVVGRVLPKKWFHYDEFPYALYPFEKEGRLYEKLRIRSWQQKVPDMSRIFPRLMPPKKFDFNDFSRLPRMIQETCVAELIHGLLCFSGLYCMDIWHGVGGKIIAVLYFLGNLPFILIQRYNRPRLVRLMNNAERRGRQCGC